MILRKCPRCKLRLRNKQELEQLEKDVGKKNKCKCGSKLAANITEEAERKRWFGYISTNNARKIDYMVLVENIYYDDESVDVRIPLLNLEFETEDRGLVISRCDEYIEQYLIDTYSKKYDEVAASVNKATTILVVGDQDIRKLAGHEKSSKHRKAEDLISKGQPIRIIGESDFLRVVKVHVEPATAPESLLRVSS